MSFDDDKYLKIPKTAAYMHICCSIHFRNLFEVDNFRNETNNTRIELFVAAYITHFSVADRLLMMTIIETFHNSKKFIH